MQAVCLLRPVHMHDACTAAGQIMHPPKAWLPFVQTQSGTMLLYVADKHDVRVKIPEDRALCAQWELFASTDLVRARAHVAGIPRAGHAYNSSLHCKQERSLRDMNFTESSQLATGSLFKPSSIIPNLCGNGLTLFIQPPCVACDRTPDCCRLSCCSTRTSQRAAWRA